jgi:hypothetical protein
MSPGVRLQVFSRVKKLLVASTGIKSIFFLNKCNKIIKFKKMGEKEEGDCQLTDKLRIAKTMSLTIDRLIHTCIRR